ncbi:MAG TPA: hypothetical protein VIJ21_05805 [Solirubrobacterales bacterium]
MTVTTDIRGPLERAALAAPLEPGEKRRVLLGLARLLEQRPGGDVAIGELRRATHLHRMNLVHKLDRLEGLGLIQINRGGVNERTRYRLTLTDLPENTTKKENQNMKTATKTREKLFEHRSFKPTFFEPLQITVWPIYDELRDAHIAACERLAEAETDEQEGEALLALAGALNEAAVELRANYDGAIEAVEEAERPLRPPEGRGDLSETSQEAQNARAAQFDAEYQAQARSTKAARKAVRADGDVIRNLGIGGRLGVATEGASAARAAVRRRGLAASTRTEA